MTIKARYESLKQEQPNLRARDAAQELNISEGELLAAHVGETATRLVDDPQAILGDLEPLGTVMALTRNESCVHERKGVYQGGQFFKHGTMEMGLFANPDIDLRLFLHHWEFAFALDEQGRKSLQFFDRAGGAVHKIYLSDDSDIRAYNQLVIRHRHPQQITALAVKALPPTEDTKADCDVDWVAFRQAWETLKDTHDFHPMLRRFKVGRQQAFAQIGVDFAYEVDTSAGRRVLELARDRGCEIMVFVGNRGAIQIHTGRVENLAVYGPWYNVLDPLFDLHLREENIARAWVNKKPTDDGLVTALDLFNAEGQVIASLFGKRKPGQAELTLWRDIVADLPTGGRNNVA